MNDRPLDELRLHPDAESVPLPDQDTYDQMVEDIAARGVVVPLDITDDGTILDGRTRFRIARNLGIRRLPVRVVAPADEFDYMLRAALLRRHLTVAQRKGIAASLLREEPTRSDRSVARDTGLGRDTVGTVRHEMEESGELSETDSRTGLDGRTRPVSPRPGLSDMEAAVFTPEEQARRRLEGVVSLQLVPAVEAIAADAEHLTRDERSIIEGAVRTLTQAATGQKGLRVVGGTG